jgi:tyrosine-specific transport protein
MPRAIAMLCGTVIGAGVLGIPYVVAKAGFVIGILSIVLLGLAVFALNLFIGEIVLRTPGNHQLPGYAEKYLGKWGKRVFMFSMFFGIYGALIAYLIGEGRALSTIFGGNPLFYSLGFFLIASFLVHKGLDSISKSEQVLVFFVLSLVLFISLFGFFSGKFNFSNLSSDFELMNLFIPYGVILFSFVGGAAIPEMKECLIKDRDCMKKSIIIGSLIPIATYVLFAFVVVGVTGLNTTEIATVGLGEVLGTGALVLSNLFAALAMLTSFLTLGLAMKEIYIYDYNLNKFLSWGLTVFVPLIIFLAGASSFIKVIGITGALAGGIDGVLIVLMFWIAKKKGGRIPEYDLGKQKLLGIVLITVFILGFIYQLFNL